MVTYNDQKQKIRKKENPKFKKIEVPGPSLPNGKKSTMIQDIDNRNFCRLFRAFIP